MPLYDYKCKSCGHKDSEFRRMAQIIPGGPAEVCPECGMADYVRQITVPHTDLKEFHTPIEMYSVAVENLQDVREMKRRCPDADVSDDPRDPMYGVPIARTRKAKQQILKASGHVEINSERVRR